MQLARWCTVLWPGLAGLWLRGSWMGLLAACGFAMLLNLALLSTVVWVELLHPAARFGAWVAVTAAWLIAAAISARRLLGANGDETAEVDLFIAAQTEYLRGNWYQAETLLGTLLDRNPDDVDARLLLASLFRRAKRPDAAGDQLRHVARLDGAEKWQLEISREWQLLREPSAEPIQTLAETADPDVLPFAA